MPKLDTYAENQNLYVGLDYLDQEFNDWLPYTDITVNVGQLPFLESAIDTNNNGTTILDFLIKNGFGEPAGYSIPSGFCVFPVFRFNAEKLREIDCVTFEAYARLHGVCVPINEQITSAEMAKNARAKTSVCEKSKEEPMR